MDLLTEPFLGYMWWLRRDLDVQLCKGFIDIILESMIFMIMIATGQESLPYENGRRYSKS